MRFKSSRETSVRVNLPITSWISSTSFDAILCLAGALSTSASEKSAWVDEIHRIVLDVGVSVEGLWIGEGHRAVVGVGGGPAAGAVFEFAPPGVV